MWTSDDVPVHQDSWAVTDNAINKTPKAAQLRDTNLGRRESCFADTRTSLIKHFRQRFNVMEHQLQIIKSAVTADNERGTKSNFSQVAPDHWDLTSPIWAPLGLVPLMLSLPLIGVISFKGTLYDLHKQIQFDKNKVELMKVAPEEHLSSAANENCLTSYVRKEVKESQANLSQVVHLIP